MAVRFAWFWSGTFLLVILSPSSATFRLDRSAIARRLTPLFWSGKFGRGTRRFISL